MGLQFLHSQFVTQSHRWSNQFCSLVFWLFSFQWQLVLDATYMISCYIHVRPAGPSELTLPCAAIAGYRPGRAAWTLGLQCHVQKLDSWTETWLAEQISAHLSKALWCEQTCLVHNEVQWMKYNPRSTSDVSNPTIDLLYVKEQVPHIVSSCPTSLSVKHKRHFPVTAKPWNSTEKL